MSALTDLDVNGMMCTSGQRKGRVSMPTTLGDYGVLAYWVLYLAFMGLPRLLYRREQMFAPLDMIRRFPQHRRALGVVPRLTSGVTVLSLMIVFAMWMSPSYVRTTTTHAIGIAYGVMLTLDAVSAWITGVRPILGLRPRYVVLPERGWRPALQFTLALLFLAIPVLFLLNS
jgi:hypothetical protein